MSKVNENDNIKNEISSDTNNSQSRNIYVEIEEIDIRLQEIDVQIDLYEESQIHGNEGNISIEELDELRREHRELRKKRRKLVKESKGGWDKVPVWIFIYGILQVIFSSLVLLTMASALFSSWFVGIFFPSGNVSKFWGIFSLLVLPFISVLISTIILILIKDKTTKKFFRVIYIIQLLETIIAVVFMLRAL